MTDHNDWKALLKLANASFHALIEEVESEDGVWYGFSHQRDAYESGYIGGWRAALEAKTQPTLPDRETLATALSEVFEMGAELNFFREADAVLALLGEASTNE